MNTIMGILKFGGKTSLQLMKTAVSFAAGTVVTFCAFYGLVFLPPVFLPRIPRNPSLFLGTFGVQSLMVAAFAGGFYLTFKLLEPKMAARKKLLVATLGIVLPLASFFALTYTPIRGAAELSRGSGPPSPPKPYEEAIYDVYSGLLIGEITQRPLLDKLTNPIPEGEGVLIRIDTTTETGPSHGPGFETKPASLLGNITPQEQFDKAVSFATADYARRNKQSFQLQRKFNLPKYDLITTAEEEAVLKDEGHDQEGSGCREFVRKHPDFYRWVELSAVGFNEDQTVAYVYIVEWGGSPPLCKLGIFGHGGPRVLHKRRNGKWYLMDMGFFAEWTT